MTSTKVIHHDPIWYPFTQMQEFLNQSPHSIAAGEGNYLIDTEGRRYLDGVSSLWANIHGHRKQEIDDAIKEQLGKIAHSTMLGLTHEPGMELARRLVSITPNGLTRVFYSDSGATSVEIAIKMAYQYCQLTGQTKRTKFIKLGEAYHGDTIGSVSVGGMDLFHDRFRDLIFDTIDIPAPDIYHHPFGDVTNDEARKKYFDLAQSIIEKHSESACALIMEPLIQGAAGMIVHPEGFLRHIRDLTKKHGILLIADEVAVGFGRTGKMFACNHEKVEPDLLCLAKGITGGYLPLAATLATAEIFEAFLGEYAELKTFFHGHTYTGNPLACAAALASLDLFDSERLLSEEVYGPKAKKYAEWMGELSQMPQVGSVRFRGMMGGVEIVRDKATKESYPFELRIGHRIITEAKKHGVMVRPLGDTVVVLPPLSITTDQLDTIFSSIAKAIEAVTSEL